MSPAFCEPLSKKDYGKVELTNKFSGITHTDLKPLLVSFDPSA